jgi:haloacid dehalogenase superfamily, subfamily IA, variant 3 with third motif having DD or ED/haloacid dehalogenase superfamily, subfamily IA, variant 1 with third motif having Dx(3-4)D or Dx(3-4)E
MELKGIVFDMDQTLYDREASDLVAMERYFNDERPRFKPGITLDYAQKAMQRADRLGGHFGWQRIVEYLKEAGVFSIVPDPAEICAHFQVSYGSISVPYKDTIPSLLKLREMGLRVGLITNGKETNQWPKIRHLNIEKCFDAILIGSDPATCKPNAAIFNQMAELLSLKPENLMYVGDHPVNDVEASRNAGYTPVWITTMPWDFPEVERPEYEIDRIGEIVPLAQSLLNRR